MNSTLVKLLGFPSTLIHGDTLVLDRWLWLRRRLPSTKNQEKLIDIGCGSAAYTIGATLRGYQSLGLSWDETCQSLAKYRAKLCNAENAKFSIQDVRKLEFREDLKDQFDVAICCEVIEHILDDFKLIEDISRCLKPGGRLLLTTPNYFYNAISEDDKGPFCDEETGWHVRRGYSKGMLLEVCKASGLVIEEISYCSGFKSQKVTYILRLFSRINHLLAWLLVFPLRIFTLLIDVPLSTLINWPYYSICLVAYKPRK
jgi:2-polyprenyl-3-methyl-5-hydroxy-6-metoxy-1,4-benzoquinol methylase